MKMFWVVLTIGLTFAEKLHRTYLPPPRPSLSGKNPATIDIPFKLPERKHNNEGFAETPEVNAEITRFATYQAGDISDEIFKYKPKILDNINSLSLTTKLRSPGFKHSSPFLKRKEYFMPSVPEVIPSNDFDNFQQNYDVEKYPRISLYEKNRVYLPSYGGDNDNHEFYITLPSPVINGKGVNDEYKLKQPDTGNSKDTSSLNLNVQHFNSFSSTLSPDYLNTANRNMTPHDYNNFSTTTIIPSEKGPTMFNHIKIHRPQRIQAQADQQAVILNYEQLINSEGYAYSYDTSNGIHGKEKGTAINGVKAEGSYSYLGDDGVLYKVEYTADQNGFVPKGAHLPTAPPIPDAILKVIELATRDKEAGLYDDGFYDEEKYGYKKYQTYPQTIDMVNRANFADTDNSDLFDEYHDSYEQNRIEKLDKSQKIEFTDIHYTNNSVNHDNNDEDKINNTSPSKIIVLNKNYQYPSSQPNLDVSTLNKNGKASGYEYLPPQTPAFNANFKSRFSGVDLTETKENNTEEVTRKPFLTPYVTRRGENSEITDYDDFAHLDTDSSKDLLENRYKENNGDDTNNKPINTDTDIDSREFISEGIQEQQEQYGDRIHEEVNFYQNANKSLLTLSPGVSYTTAAPIDFPTGISVQDVNHTSGRGPSSLQTYSITNTTILLDNSSARLPISRLPTNAISSVLVNESTSVNPDAYNKTNSITTSQTIQTTILVPKFGMRYKPTSESSQYTEYNVQTSTENTIRVNFSGQN